MNGMYCRGSPPRPMPATGVVRVNAKPYPSDLTGTNINVFVSVEGWYELLQATPDEGRSRQGITGRPGAGTMSASEVLDEGGEAEALTLPEPTL
jgi:hypothetical protein